MNKLVREIEVDENELFEVLRDQVTLDAVRVLLKEKELASSASSWNDMFEKRLKPTLLDGSLQHQELIRLIGEFEEYGNKHVRLYSFEPSYLAQVTKILDPSVISSWARKRNYPEAGAYAFHAKPVEPVISEVRTFDGEERNCLVLKIVRTETKKNRTAEIIIQDGKEYLAYQQESYRAVDVIKIHSGGLVEVRLHPRHDARAYRAAEVNIIKVIGEIIDTSQLLELDLSEAKNAFAHKDSNPDKVANFRISKAGLRTDSGLRGDISLPSELESEISSDQIGREICKVFHGHKESSYCEDVSVSFNFRDIKWIRVLLPKTRNELVFLAMLSKDEHTTVLREVLKVNGGD